MAIFCQKCGARNDNALVCRICGKEFIGKNGQQRGNSSVPLYATAFIIIVAFMAATLYPVPAVKFFFSSLAADISGAAHGIRRSSSITH